MGEQVGRMCSSRAAAARGQTAAVGDGEVRVVVVVDWREQPIRSQDRGVGGTRLGLAVGRRGDRRVGTVVPVCVVAGSAAAQLPSQCNDPIISVTLFLNY